MSEYHFDTSIGEIISVHNHEWHSKEVTHTFDRSKIYCRVLRPDDEKYKVGLNSKETIGPNDWFYPPNLSENEGGFYFTDVDNILPYFGWGNHYCFVEIPNDAIIYKQNPRCHFGCNVWRADKIILSAPTKISKENLEKLYKMGMKITEEGYNIDDFAGAYNDLYTEQELSSIKQLLHELKYNKNVFP